MKNVSSDILTGFGLVITLLGAWITARAGILKENDAISLGLSRMSGKDREEQLRLPMVQNLLASSRGARRGLWFIVVGTAFQIVPVAVRLVSLVLA